MTVACRIFSIGSTYNSIKPSLKKALKDLLPGFVTVNDELSLKKRKEDGLKEAIAAVKVSNSLF